MASKLSMFMVCAIVVVIAVSMCDGWGCKEAGSRCRWDGHCCSRGCLYDYDNCMFWACFGELGECMDYEDVQEEGGFFTNHYMI